MHTPLRLGLELPPLPLTGDDAPIGSAARLGDLRDVATRAAQLGFDALWLAEPPPGNGSDGTVHADGCTLAANLAQGVPSLFFGVAIGDRDGRHPSMAARDVTALDHVTSGRAALLLRYASAGDAVTICRGMFTRETTTVDGSEFRTQAAVNRPGPVQPGGPPLVAEVGAAGEIGTEWTTQVDAICGTGDPGELDRLGAALRSAGGASGSDKGPALWWAGALPGAGMEAAGVVHDLRDAGVTGFICRLPGHEWPTPPMVDALHGTLAECGLV